MIRIIYTYSPFDINKSTEKLLNANFSNQQFFLNAWSFIKNNGCPLGLYVNSIFQSVNKA